MRVTIKLMGPLRSRFPTGGGSGTVELRPGGTVADALRAVGVPEGEPWNASIAGQLVEADRPLRDGDELLAFPPIAGGA